MQNRRAVLDVLQDLQNWRSATGMSHEEISNLASVDLSTVYRLFDDHGPRKRLGSALKRICKIANVPIEGVTQAREVPPVVRDAVLRTWDGTTEHAKLLASAICSAGDLIRQAVSLR